MTNLNRKAMKRRHTGQKINQLNRKSANRKVAKHPNVSMDVLVIGLNHPNNKRRTYDNVHTDYVNADIFRRGKKDTPCYRLKRGKKTIGLFPMDYYKVRPWMKYHRKKPKRKKVYYNTYFKRKKSDWDSIPNFWK